MKLDPETIDVSIQELEGLVDGARHQTLNADAHRKLRGVVETLGEMARLLADKDATLRQLRQMLLKPATTEKTRVVLERAGVKPEPGEPAKKKKKRKGHGRNPARAFEGAEKMKVAHPSEAGGQVSGVLEWESVPAERAGAAGADRGTSAGAGGGVRTGAAALQLVPGGVRSAAASRDGRGQARRNGG